MGTARGPWIESSAARASARRAGERSFRWAHDFSSKGRHVLSASRCASASARAAAICSSLTQRPFSLRYPKRFHAESRPGSSRTTARRWAVSSAFKPCRSHQRASSHCASALFGVPARRWTYSLIAAALAGSSRTLRLTSSGFVQRPPCATKPINPRAAAFFESAKTARARCLTRSAFKPWDSHQRASLTWASASRPTLTLAASYATRSSGFADGSGVEPISPQTSNTTDVMTHPRRNRR